jgi:DNA-directed RNA polymerase subunit D
MVAELKVEEEEGEFKMKIEKINENKKSNKISFLIKDSNEMFANTIRRLIIEEVPTLAIEDLEIKDNSSALFDEMFGLRLGLTPVKTDLKSYELKENCKCEGVGCARCELKITLKATKKGNVYAEEAESTDPKCTFVHDKMPIVRLLAKQKVDVTMTAILGKGKDHVKWSPGIAFYHREQLVKVGKVQNPQQVMEKCSDGVFTLSGNSLKVNKENVYDSKLLDFYSDLDSGITLENSNNIIFNLESWGQLSCKEMLNQSANILTKKVEEMEKLI